MTYRRQFWWIRYEEAFVTKSASMPFSKASSEGYPLIYCLPATLLASNWIPAFTMFLSSVPNRFTSVFAKLKDSFKVAAVILGYCRFRKRPVSMMPSEGISVDGKPVKISLKKPVYINYVFMRIKIYKMLLLFQKIRISAKKYLFSS